MEKPVNDELISKVAWDPIAAIEQMRKEAPPRFGRKLSLAQQCEAYAALQSGAAQKVVSDIFGLSAASICHLANCRNHAPGREWRYSDVWRTWRDLGEEEFLRRYYSEDLDLKIKRWRYKVPGPLDSRRTAAANPIADKYSFTAIGSFTVNSPRPWVARVDWADCQLPDDDPRYGPPGWRYTSVEPEGSPFHNVHAYNGQEALNSELPVFLPFRTSADAFDAAHRQSLVPSPRTGAGRPAR